MSARLRFACDFCRARPDDETRRSLTATLRTADGPAFVDALPGRWLVWRGGGALGPRRYACDEHRGDLTAYLRLHYAAISACVWRRPPHPEVWPDGARRPPAQLRPAEGEPRPPAARAEPASPFLALARTSHAALDDLLLAMAAEFRPVDRRLAYDRLDELSRCLFGLDRLDPAGQAGCVAHALRHELRLHAGDPRDPEGMFLDRVLERREGHPLVLAVVAVELARRAGAPAWVCSAPTRLFAGFGTESMRFVEVTPPAQPAPEPATVVRHCPDAVAFGILCGLRVSYARMPGREGEAHRALALQRVLREERTEARRRP